MRTTIMKRDNSAVIELPVSIMAAARLRIGQSVDVYADGGRIVVEPVAPLAYDLATLLDAMTPETFPESAEFGDPAGREFW